MNKQKGILSSILFFSLILVGLAQIGLAAEDIDYCGIQEDESYEWNINFDENVMENIAEDYVDWMEANLYGDGSNGYDYTDAIPLSLGEHVGLSVLSDSEKLYKVNVNEGLNLSFIFSFNDMYSLDIDLHTENSRYVGEGENDIYYTYTNYTGDYYIEIESYDSTDVTFNLTISTSIWNNENSFSGTGYYDNFGNNYTILEDETQWFKISDIPKNKNLTITLNLNNSADIDLDLHDSEIDGLDYSYSNGETTVLVWENSDYSDVFYLRVEGDTFYDIGFDITISTTELTYSDEGSYYDPISQTEDIIDGLLNEYSDAEKFKVTVDDIKEGDEEYYDFDYAEIEIDIEIFHDGEWSDLEDMVEDFYEDTYNEPFNNDYMDDMTKRMIIDGNDIDMDAFNYLFFGAIFMPTNIDWEDLSEMFNDMNDYLSMQGMSIDCEENTNGFDAELDLGSEMENIDATVSYNNKGVLEYLQVKYEGIEVGTIRLNSLIPGYNLVFISAILSIGSIGLIVAVMRKRVK